MSSKKFMPLIFFNLSLSFFCLSLSHSLSLSLSTSALRPSSIVPATREDPYPQRRTFFLPSMLLRDHLKISLSSTITIPRQSKKIQILHSSRCRKRSRSLRTFLDCQCFFTIMTIADWWRRQLPSRWRCKCSTSATTRWDRGRSKAGFLVTAVAGFLFGVARPS